MRTLNKTEITKIETVVDYTINKILEKESKFNCVDFYDILKTNKRFNKILKDVKNLLKKEVKQEMENNTKKEVNSKIIYKFLKRRLDFYDYECITVNEICVKFEYLVSLIFIENEKNTKSQKEIKELEKKFFDIYKIEMNMVNL